MDKTDTKGKPHKNDKIVEEEYDELELLERLESLREDMEDLEVKTLAEVIEQGASSRAELDLVDSAGLDLRVLEQDETAATARLEEQSRALTSLRTRAAERAGGVR